MVKRGLFALALLLTAGCEGMVVDQAARTASACDDALWIEEGDAVATALPCVASDSRLVGPLPRGARHERGLFIWTPGLDQADLYRVTLSTGDSTRTIVIGVADRFDAPDNLPLRSPQTYTHEMGLPVFHLTLDPGIAAETYSPATVVHGGHQYQAQAKLRGNSSLAYPKKHFTLNFAAGDRFDDPENGFRRRDKLTLRSSFDDNSYLRERMAFEVWNRLNPTGVRVQTASAVVYINGQYQGLYTVTDHIDGDLMVANGLPGGGNLYKAVSPASNFYHRKWIDTLYEKKEGLPGSYEDLQELVDFVLDADDDTFGREIPGRIQLDDYIAWLITSTAICASDTLGKNAYHYHPADGPWRVVPWDFNESWGQDWSTMRELATDPEELASGNNLFRRLLADPTLGEAVRARYARAMTDGINAVDVLRLVDVLAARVGASARRDERRWRQAYLGFERWKDRTDFNDFDGEVAYLRRWIERRWAGLHQTYVAKPMLDQVIE